MVLAEELEGLLKVIVEKKEATDIEILRELNNRSELEIEIDDSTCSWYLHELEMYGFIEFTINRKWRATENAKDIDELIEHEKLTGDYGRELYHHLASESIVPVWLAFMNSRKWRTLFGDAEDVKKFFNQSWTNTFIKGIDEYYKVEEIGTGEREVGGVKVSIEKVEKQGVI